MTEVRVKNEKTGGEKGSKPEAMSLLPLDVLRRHVAPHYLEGAKKYARDNWRRGYDWSLSADALLRHFAAFWSDREDYDEETGTRHLAAVVFHALALLYFMDAHPDLDDRPRLDAPAVEPEDEARARALDAYAAGTAASPPTWPELEEAPLCQAADCSICEPEPQPCPLKTVSPDGACQLADRFPGGYAQCLDSCKRSSS